MSVELRRPADAGLAQGNDGLDLDLSSHQEVCCKLSDELHFQRFVFGEHHGDWEAAYEDFATNDDDAPACCKDDFREIVFRDDGEDVDNPEQPSVHPDYQIYQVNPRFHEVATRVQVCTVCCGWS